MTGSDEITLTGVRTFGRHGVYAQERRDGQYFIVDATMHLDATAAAASDEVADTVHYGEVAERIAQIVAGESVNLLETLAARIADELLTHDIVQSARVTVHKPEAPIAVAFDDVSVTVTRSRDVR